MADVKCTLEILDEERTRYSDTYRRTPITGRVRDDQDGDSLVRDTIERFHEWVAIDDRNITREDLELLGRHLYYLLFDETIRDAFEQSYQGFHETQDSDARLRLVLAFHKPAQRLASYPWEFLFMPRRENKPGFFICAERRTELILTRFVPEQTPTESVRPVDTALKVLVAFSNPRDLGSRLNADAFIQEISAMKQITVEVVTEPAKLTRDTLRDEIRRFGPHIVHFIAHGDVAKGIALMRPPEEIQREYDETSRLHDADWVDSRTLSTLFAPPGPRLVFLHGCEGAAAATMRSFNSMAHELVYDYGVPAVVAMQYVISNDAAARFATTFYRELSDGKPIDVAVSEGRWELRKSQRGEFADRGFGTPLVYLQREDAIVLHRIEEEDGSADRSVPCPYDCGGRVFVGNVLCGKCTRPLAVCEQGHVMAADRDSCPQGHPARDRGVAAAPSIALQGSHVESGRTGVASGLRSQGEPGSTDRLRAAYEQARGTGQGE